MVVGALPAPVLCGLIAGLLSLCGCIPYICDTLRGRCRPQRSSWLIWSVPSCVFFYNHVTEGAGAFLYFCCGIMCLPGNRFLDVAAMGDGQLSKGTRCLRDRRCLHRTCPMVLDARSADSSWPIDPHGDERRRHDNDQGLQTSAY